MLSARLLGQPLSRETALWAQGVGHALRTQLAAVFFGPGRALRAVTPGDAEQLKAWLLTQPLAPATIAKRPSFARSFFHLTRKHRLIEENPFREVKIPSASGAFSWRAVSVSDRSCVNKAPVADAHGSPECDRRAVSVSDRSL